MTVCQALSVITVSASSSRELVLHSGVGSSLSFDVITEGVFAVHAIHFQRGENFSATPRIYAREARKSVGCNLSNEETCPDARALGASAFQNRKYSQPIIRLDRTPETQVILQVPDASSGPSRARDRDPTLRLLHNPTI